MLMMAINEIKRASIRVYLAMLASLSLFLFLTASLPGCGGAGGPDIDIGALAPGKFENIIWPLSGTAEPAPLSSTFGPRIRSSTDDYDFHRGLDMPTPEGTDVRAIAPGVIKHAGDHPDYDEPIVHLVHCADPVLPPTVDECEALVYSNYQHLQRAMVAAGDFVEAGQVIGKSGSSRSGAPHLHLEIRYSSLNQRWSRHPLAWLPHEDSGPPDLTIDAVDLADPGAPRVALTVTRPPSELDFVRVEVELLSARTGESMASQSYDVNEWNELYTGDSSPNINLDNPEFNDVTVDPEPFNTQAAAYVVHFLFRGLTSSAPADEVRVVARALDVSGNQAETECNPCPTL